MAVTDSNKTSKSLPSQSNILTGPGTVGANGGAGILPEFSDTTDHENYSGSAGATRTADPSRPGQKTAIPVGLSDSQRLFTIDVPTPDRTP